MEAGTSAILIAVGSIVGVVITKFVDAVVKLWGVKTTTDKGVRQDTLNEYKDLLTRQQEQINRLTERVDALQQENSETERNYARAEERIAHLEDALTERKIPFRPWKPTAAMGSGSYPKKTNEKPAPGGDL